MPKRPRVDVKDVAQVYADAVMWMVEHFYCVGAATRDEYRAAAVDWVTGWLAEMAKDIAPGTVCPSKR